MRLSCPEEEPLKLSMKDCTVTVRDGYQNINFIEGKNVSRVYLEGVALHGLCSRDIVCEP